MRLRALVAGSVFAVAGVIAPVADAPSAQTPPNAGTVRTWNANALAALGAAGQPPNVAVLHMAMVQGAVYDAVNSIDGGHEPFLAGLPAASPTASMDAAVATAAYRVLDGLGRAPVPALPDAVRANLLIQYDQTLASIPDGSAKTLGVEAGAAAAMAMLEARDGDGRYVPFPLTVGTEPGEWRPAPPGDAIDPNSWVSEVEPFTLLSTSQFRTPGPRNLNSAAYAHEYDEVKTPRRGQQPAQPGAGSGRPLLQRQPVGAAQPYVPDHLRDAGAEPGRGRAVVRDAQRRGGGRHHQLLERQAVPLLLAADHSDPRGRQRRQQADGRRHELDAARADPAVLRPRVRVQLHRRVADERRQGVLRQRPAWTSAS